MPSLTMTGAFEDYETLIEVYTEVSFRSGPYKVGQRVLLMILFKRM